MRLDLFTGLLGVASDFLDYLVLNLSKPMHNQDSSHHSLDIMPCSICQDDGLIESILSSAQLLYFELPKFSKQFGLVELMRKHHSRAADRVLYCTARC